MPRTSYAIALGSNRRHGRHGAPARVIRAAIDTLASEDLAIARISPVIRTAAFGPAGRSFANAAAIIESDLPPPALLTLLKRIERAFGRRRGRRWGPRVLDLDILLWSNGGWPSSSSAKRGSGRTLGTGLAIPHPSLAERRFVLDPLVRIAPQWRSPGNGRTVRQMHHRLTRRAPLD